MQGSTDWVVDGIMGAIDALVTPILDALGYILQEIAEFTVWTPHPKWESASQIMSPPADGTIWASIWETHWEVMVPASLAILVVTWFARQFGVAAGIVGAEQGARSKRNLITGFSVVLVSWWIVGAYLNFAHALAEIVTPNAAEMANAIPEIGITSVGVAAAFYYLELTVGATLFVLLILVNIIRIIAVYAFAILFPILMAVYYARLPVIDGMFKGFAEKLATPAMWTFPVAAGWRVMVVLNSSDDGIIAAMTNASGVGIDAIDGIITPFIFMIPAIVGIASPLLMSDVSQLYYLNNMANMSLGSDSGGSDPGSGDGTGGSNGSGGSGVGDGDPTTSGQDRLDSMAQGGGSTPDYYTAPQGERETSTRNALSAGKEKFDFLDEDSNVVDWENVDKTKDRAKAAGSALKSAGERGKSTLGVMAAQGKGLLTGNPDDFPDGGGDPQGTGDDPQGDPRDPDPPDDFPWGDSGEPEQSTETGQEGSNTTTGGSGSPSTSGASHTVPEESPSSGSSSISNSRADNLQDIFGEAATDSQPTPTESNTESESNVDEVENTDSGLSDGLSQAFDQENIEDTDIYPEGYGQNGD